jgi:hypothetical protein
MGIPPTAFRIGIGVAGLGIAAAVGYGVTRMNDGIMARNPTGSAGDGKVGWATVGVGAGGLVVAALGGIAFIRGARVPGAALMAAGGAAMLGTVGGAVATSLRHGTGVDTEASQVLERYDRGFFRDDQLDLGSFWSQPEYLREEVETEDLNDDGDTSDTGERTSTWYEIGRLAFDADVNDDRVATRGELVDVITSHDADGNGRLVGRERREYEAQHGEREVWGGWGSDYDSGW